MCRSAHDVVVNIYVFFLLLHKEQKINILTGVATLLLGHLLDLDLVVEHAAHELNHL